MDFGDKLKALRLGAGLTQEGLARAAGFTTSVVSKLEQKLVSDPGWQTVRALAKALGVDCRAFEVEDTPPAVAESTPKKDAKGREENVKRTRGQRKKHQ
jgi:transcriptional regulator with XRE-family HTH domain